MTAGWGWPLNARKAHYFDADDSVAVCRRWMFTGPRDDNETGTPGPDDCAACRKVLVRRAAIKRGHTP